MILSKYEGLLRGAGITQDELELIKKESNNSVEFYLTVYFIVNKSGAVAYWKKIYDEILNSPKDENNPYSEYICESNHHYYCNYLELIDEISQSISVDVKEFVPMNYTDYVEKIMKK